MNIPTDKKDDDSENDQMTALKQASDETTHFGQAVKWLQNRKWFVIIAFAVLSISFLSSLVEDLTKLKAFVGSGSDKGEKPLVVSENMKASAEELIEILALRAKKITERLEAIRIGIDEAAFKYRNESCDGDHDTSICNDMDKASFEKGQEFTALSKKFSKLHADHLIALKSGKLAVAHEIENDIQQVLTTEFDAIAVGNIGFEPGNYQSGFKYTVVDVRDISGYQSKEQFVYLP